MLTVRGLCYRQTTGSFAPYTRPYYQHGKSFGRTHNAARKHWVKWAGRASWRRHANLCGQACLVTQWCKSLSCMRGERAGIRQGERFGVGCCCYCCCCCCCCCTQTVAGVGVGLDSNLTNMPGREGRGRAWWRETGAQGREGSGVKAAIEECCWFACHPALMPCAHAHAVHF